MMFILLGFLHQTILRSLFMKKLILLSCLISFPIFAKETTPPCTLTLNESPKVRGIWLGMSEKEFLRVVPTARI